MANVIINDTNLTNIAAAIREKNGTETKYKPSEMAAAISAITGGDTIPDEAFQNAIYNEYRFYGNGWTWLINHYGDRFETLRSADYMFARNTYLSRIPFSLERDDCNHLFEGCMYLYSLPTFTTINELGDSYDHHMSCVFRWCYRLRYIPTDFFGTRENTNSPATESIDSARNSIFQACYSLRELPDLSKMINLVTDPKKTLYYEMADECYALNKISNLPVSQAELTDNAFVSTARNCFRINEFTFTPGQTANWSKQYISLQYAGYLPMSYDSTLGAYNSGISMSTEVTNYSSYEELKDDPNWWTKRSEYSRFRHGAAVNTINSLPDCSAYLDSTGNPVNTISFDRVAIDSSEFTEEEIAVAAAKGWTVAI